VDVTLATILSKLATLKQSVLRYRTQGIETTWATWSQECSTKYRQDSEGGFMQIPKVCLGLLVSLALGLTLYAQGLTDGILVRLPSEVVVNDKRIPAGEYEFRKKSGANDVISIFNRDELMYETNVIPISIQKKDVVEDPKIVIQKVGNDFYLTQVWIQPDRLGYEVPLPERVRALKKELEQSVSGKVVKHGDSKDDTKTKTK
jgi:hypothetical protein